MAEDHEPLVFHFASSPSPHNLYYVESPSTVMTTTTAISHPAPASAFLSDDVSESNATGNMRPSDDASRLVLSRYSSSRGSNNSFVNEKKTAYTNGTFKSGTKRQVLRIVRNHGEEAEDQEEEEEESRSMRRQFWRSVSIDPKSSVCCIVFQLTWRLALSIAFAFLVFFLATKPPSPHFSLKVDKMEQFRLGEGSDNSGVITNILDCNCSISMQVENHSKIFGLRIDSTVLQMAFSSMNFAISQGEDSYVKSQSSKTIKFFITVKNKPMYGAGRTMQDLLDSNSGLQITVLLKSRLLYHIVGNLIKIPYNVHTNCLIFLKGSHKTRMYNSFCQGYKFHA